MSTREAVYSYGRSEIRRELGHAIAGAAVAAVMLSATRQAPVFATLFAGLLCLFAAYGAKSLLKRKLRVRLTDAGLVIAPPRFFFALRKDLRWEDLAEMRLRFYSQQRDRKEGRFALRLRTPSQRVTLDSTLDGFETILQAATRHARSNGLAIDRVTEANLDSFGYGNGLTAPEAAE